MEATCILEIYFRVSQTEPLYDIFMKFASRKCKKFETLTFKVNGKVISNESTVRSLKLEEHGQIVTTNIFFLTFF